MVDKKALLATLIATLKAEVGTAKRRARDAADAATHEESRAENSKDTRATEASYVARGQAAHAAELESSLAALSRLTPRDFDEREPVALGALVDVDSEGARTCYFLLPAAGGRDLDGGPETIATLTTRSPLGRALLGAALGDAVEFAAPQGARTVEIVKVR